MGHLRTRQQDPGYPAREPGTADTKRRLSSSATKMSGPDT